MTKQDKVLKSFQYLIDDLNLDTDDTSEQEGNDHRYDFLNEYSVWIREDGTIEGSMPIWARAKTEAWFKKNKFEGEMRYC